MGFDGTAGLGTVQDEISTLVGVCCVPLLDALYVSVTGDLSWSNVFFPFSWKTGIGGGAPKGTLDKTFSSSGSGDNRLLGTVDGPENDFSLIDFCKKLSK